MKLSLNSLKSIFQTNWFVLLLFISILIVYGPLVLGYRFAHGDDYYLIYPLLSIDSLKQYLDALFNIKLIDIQPVRDLSYFLDLKLANYYGFKVFFISNLIIWFFSMLQLRKVLSRFITSSNVCAIIVIFFSIYPTFTWVLPASSARKHLLSFFFSLLFINEINEVRDIKNQLKLITYYVLSIYSNPISIFIGLLPILYDLLYIKDKFVSQIKFYFFLIFILSLTLGLNIWYYSHFLFAKDGGPTLQDTNLSLSVLAMGRFFFQLIIPISFSSYYNANHLFDYIGLILFVLIFIIYYKHSNKKDFIFVFFLYSCNLFIPIVRVSHNFISDAYLLLPAVAFSMIISRFLSHLESKKIFMRRSLIFIILLVTIIKSNSEVKIWSNRLNLTRVSYLREKNCKNLIPYVNNLLLDGLFGEIDQNSGMFYNSCGKNELSRVLFSSIVYALNGAPGEKIKALKNINHSASYLLIDLINFEQTGNQEIFKNLEIAKMRLRGTGDEYLTDFISAQIERICKKDAKKCILTGNQK